MATYTRTKCLQFPVNAWGGSDPGGNLTTLQYSLTINSSGIWVTSDKTTAIVATDVMRLGVIPAGMSLEEAIARISTGTTATCTFKLGFAYVDGVDDSNVPQNDAYFFAASTDSATAAFLKQNTTTAPVVLPKDAFLIMTNAVATYAKAAQIDFFIRGELKGIK